MKTTKILCLILSLAMLCGLFTACGGGADFDSHFLMCSEIGAVSVAMAKQEGEYERGHVATTVNFSGGNASIQEVYSDTDGQTDTVSIGRYPYSASGNTLTVDGKTYKFKIENDKITFEESFYGHSTWDWESY